MAKSYGVSRKSLVRWVAAYRERGVVHKSGGKPRTLTVAMKANIISEMTGNVYEKTVAEENCADCSRKRCDVIFDSTRIPNRSISRGGTHEDVISICNVLETS